ncbi:MAG: TRAM domain-containing protein [Gemmatimonadales bacterium]|nr:TRAM domain-containing protein [Gemmatimonadales bacterium]NIN11687.1 TRAM domain-containing protein [Gemmatimonadales bacterium]NIN50293.1 TRAM domain-containing protein [Gemmatimonadales bacterium]NIP07757.1 TRAM domain-containing protein [Gemmatimonadales bacterium]NIQ99160.1 TRAM domain-containing protein [Gemmatimonadales bacterium]
MKIDRIAAGGDGVGRLDDGMAVFVPRTVPGDVVEIEIVQRKRRYARGRVRRIVAHGAGRVEATCSHYVADGCGGCQLQHLAPSVQLEVKRRIVGDAVRRIGGRSVADPEIVPCPSAWRYRSKITLRAQGRSIGLHRFDCPGEVFDLADCPITQSRLIELWRQVRSHRHLLPRSVATLVLREDRDGGLHVVVEGRSERLWDAGPLAQAIGDSRVSWWWCPRLGAPRVVAGPHRGFPALAFDQVHPGFGRRIRGDAVEALGSVAGQTVWDLYGGVGDTAELLAARGAQVWTVDADRSAVEWARARESSPQGTGEIHRLVGRVEAVLHQLPEPDAVVANPPRGGLDERVTRHLETWATGRSGARVAYLSCDPATLARDLKRMPALQLTSYRAYDLFPHTSHVETLALLEVS